MLELSQISQPRLSSWSPKAVLSERKEQQASRLNVVAVRHPVFPESWPPSVHSLTRSVIRSPGWNRQWATGLGQNRLCLHSTFLPANLPVNFGTLIYPSNTVIINGDWCASLPHIKYLCRYFFLLWKIYIKATSLTILSVWFSGLEYIHNIVQPSHTYLFPGHCYYSNQNCSFCLSLWTCLFWGPWQVKPRSFWPFVYCWLSLRIICFGSVVLYFSS